MIGDERNEIGVAGTGGLLANVPVGWNGSAATAFSAGGGGQIWYYHQWMGAVDFGVVGFAGGTPGNGFGGAGLLFRARIVESENFRWAVEQEFGFAWYEIGLPLALRLHDDIWLYSSPSGRVSLAIAEGGTGIWLDAGVPLGISIAVGHGVAILLEVVGRLGPLVTYTQEPMTYSVSGGAGFSYRFE